MIERRRAARVTARLDAHWEGVLARCAGTIVDLSPSGCFILTTDRVRKGELMRLEVQTPTGNWLFLWGEVVYQVSEMGFALCFTGMTEVEETMLGLLIDYLRGAKEDAAVA